MHKVMAAQPNNESRVLPLRGLSPKGLYIDFTTEVV